jgi:hypothetical protein
MAKDSGIRAPFQTAPVGLRPEPEMRSTFVGLPVFLTILPAGELLFFLDNKANKW